MAASTAAALNAERSAQKLKRALLGLRQEPLLNTKAVTAVAPAITFETPQKPTVVKSESATPNASQVLGTDIFIGDTVFLAPAALPGFESPSPEPDDSPTNLLKARGRTTGKHHTKSATLKNPAAVGHATPPTTFSWGPLPVQQNTAKTTPGFVPLSGSR